MNQENIGREEAPLLEFRLSKEGRDRYDFEGNLYSIEGNIVLSDFYIIQLLAEKMNEGRDLFARPERAVRAGRLNAVGLISAVLHYISALYRRSENPGVLEKALAFLDERVGREKFDGVLTSFVEDFPSLSVYRGEETPREYLAGATAGVPNRRPACEDLLMLFLANDNPAFDPFRELFDDRKLAKNTAYREVVRLLEEFYKTQPIFGPERLPLLGMLKAPAAAAPHSLEGQLAYIRTNWMHLLPPDLLNRIHVASDVISEETRIRAPGPGPVIVPDLKAELEALEAGEEEAYERFSEDSEWMPRVVLLAKNVYVWLDQLSKRYGRRITRLDQIPDRELNTLAGWGFTGLWLIGVWERSSASRKIKQACGNPEAASSAYSLYDYVIAADLGGEAAMQNLRERAWRRGIRLSSDMVPNHTGICSKWVTEHPQWFIQTAQSPFPKYRFTGMDLSDDPRVSTYIEDGYWTRRDAAVVFKRVDRASGEVRYIYHGNDGTSMPWNDTAQLDFLKNEVREAVIQTILHVARKFPIIRFDAAMVLTRFHIQRLWYPPAGAGGAIPSRAGHGLSVEEFNRLFPREFWRDVVDRVAEEVSDTLLLAEAFWMLEGYFVRTLGMHRVYNSAFMNMLKMEMNSEYRKVMKDVLEFDPQILKRFVNFMNNPDEATAVAQFGRGDKYFGVCMMMVTMPGLPLFGHGQVEGLAERYGMEYRRAYWSEPVDGYIVRRHEAEIFPLMNKRYLFSDVENFTLYDFFMENGSVNEDVFAYSNRCGKEKALIVYHNRFSSTSGWIRTSVARAEKDGKGERRLFQVNLAQGLDLRGGGNDYCIFRDLKSGLQYIRKSRDLAEKGLHLRLNAYQSCVFMDFREVRDRPDGNMARLESSLGGRGVPDINEALKDLYLEPLHRPLSELIGEETLRALVRLGGEPEIELIEKGIESIVLPILEELLIKVQQFSRVKCDSMPIAEHKSQTIRTILILFGPDKILGRKRDKESDEALVYLRSRLPEGDDQHLVFWRVALIWAVVHSLGRVIRPGERGRQSAALMDEWRLGRVITRSIQALHCDLEEAKREARLIKIMTRHQGWWRRPHKHLHSSLRRLFGYPAVQSYLGFNRFAGELWFQKERFDDLIFWLFTASTIQVAKDADTREEAFSIVDGWRFRETVALLRSAETAGYRVKDMLRVLGETPLDTAGSKNGDNNRGL